MQLRAYARKAGECRKLYMAELLVFKRGRIALMQRQRLAAAGGRTNDELRNRSEDRCRHRRHQFGFEGGAQPRPCLGAGGLFPVVMADVIGGVVAQVLRTLAD